MKTSLTLKAKEIKLNRIKNNLPVYDGGLGENKLPPPHSMVESVKKYSHLKEYTDAGGIDRLKKILGDRLLVGNGLKPLLYILQIAFKRLYPNGNILYSAPHWVSYSEQTKLHNINYQTIDYDTNWKINLADLDKKLSPKNINLIIFNNPTNPSGCIYNKDEIVNIVKILSKYNVIVLADDIYELIIHPKHVKDFAKIKDYCNNVISGSSLSKTFACGGYRLGWFIFPEKYHQLHKTCLSIASSIYSCPSIMLQHVAADALTFPEDIKIQMNFQDNMYQTVCEYCIDKFNKINIKCSDSKAAWYILLDFSYYKEDFLKNKIFSSDDLCERLINDIGFITVSGNAFSIKDQFILRYSLVDISDIKVKKNSFNYENIKAGINVLSNWLDSICNKN